MKFPAYVAGLVLPLIVSLTHAQAPADPRLTRKVPPLTASEIQKLRHLIEKPCACRRGPRGPQGEAGPPGTPGPMGEPGTGVTGFETVITPPTEAVGAVSIVSAVCPVPKRALGGGYQVSGTGTFEVREASPRNDRFLVQIGSLDPQRPVFVIVTAVCADVRG